MKKAKMPRGPREGGRLFSKSPEVRRGLRVPARSMPFSGEYATLGLTPFASKTEVKHVYKRLALKYHPDVIRGEVGGQEKEEAFREIKSAYESLMAKFEEEVDDQSAVNSFDDEWDEWDEWMGFEGGMPMLYNPS